MLFFVHRTRRGLQQTSDSSRPRSRATLRRRSSSRLSQTSGRASSSPAASSSTNSLVARPHYRLHIQLLPLLQMKSLQGDHGGLTLHFVDLDLVCSSICPDCSILLVQVMACWQTGGTLKAKQTKSQTTMYACTSNIETLIQSCPFSV